MKWLQTIVREVFGLFVDEGRFAIMILAWVAAVLLIFPRMSGITPWQGPVLFGGLACILLVSAVRYASRTRR